MSPLYFFLLSMELLVVKLKGKGQLSQALNTNKILVNVKCLT